MQKPKKLLVVGVSGVSDDRVSVKRLQPQVAKSSLGPKGRESVGRSVAEGCVTCGEKEGNLAASGDTVTVTSTPFLTGTG